MVVYRVETPWGSGPYRRGSTDRYPDDVSTDVHNALGENPEALSTLRHPSPLHDGALGDWVCRTPYTEVMEHICGFADVEQYRAWFYTKSARRALADHGCSLVVYEVPEEHVKWGHKQVMFRKSEAREVTRMSPVLADDAQPEEMAA